MIYFGDKTWLTSNYVGDLTKAKGYKLERKTNKKKDKFR